MRLSRTLGFAVLAAGVTTPLGAAHAMSLDEQTAEYLVQFFTDSDQVSVRSAIGEWSATFANRGALSLHWNNEKVVVPAISAPAGTQEAIDAITTASRPISGNAYQDFVKVRNELTGHFQRGGAGLDYYRSDEVDYVAQQLGGSWDRDFRDRQINLSLGGSYGWDDIHPLADDDNHSTADTKTTVHVNGVATESLGPKTLLRVGLEYNVVDGLQHNPYRNVYAGGVIVPERHPDHRERRDAFVKLNQYLDARSSVKLSYRFYDDDWGIDSHEVGTTLSQYVTHGAFVSWQYRWYSQGPADFYRAEYLTPDGVDGYRTADYRMASLSSHLFGVGLDADLRELEVKTPVLGRMSFHCGYERYFNSNNYSANFLTTQMSYRF